jgi:hypothetical protein
MIDFTIETRIDRPVGEVFAYATDPAKLALRREFTKHCETLKHVLEAPA